ncbi:MAG: WxcM-like domain-containing protein [Methylococcales bacterium]|nr:WxcM-like domain-containing protein [Methylococcales bacterium]
MTAKKQTFIQNRPHYGLYMPKLNWRTMQNFSTNPLALILSSTLYNEAGCIRSFPDFLTACHEAQ